MTSRDVYSASRFGDFETFSQRLAFSDDLLAGALGATDGVGAAPVIPFGPTAGSYTGYGMLSENGPLYPEGSNWDWNQPPVAMWPMPGIGRVSSPALIYNNGGTDRFPIGLVQLTGTIMGALVGDGSVNLAGPILTIPSWADPGTNENAWFLSDCGGFTVRYGHYEGENSTFITDATHFEVPAKIAEGQVYFDDPMTNLPEPPEGADLITVTVGNGGGTIELADGEQTSRELFVVGAPNDEFVSVDAVAFP